MALFTYYVTKNLHEENDSNFFLLNRKKRNYNLFIIYMTK